MALWYHKIHSYQWVFGSIREDLNQGERSVWGDILALGSLTREPRRGYLERSEGIPYSRDKLIQLFNYATQDEISNLDTCISKCLTEGRLEQLADGTLHITNYDTYNDTKTLAENRRIKTKGIDNTKKRRARKDAVLDGATRAVNDANTALREAKKLNELVKDKLDVAIVEDKIVNTNTGEIIEDGK